MKRERKWPPPSSPLMETKWKYSHNCSDGGKQTGATSTRRMTSKCLRSSRSSTLRLGVSLSLPVVVIHGGNTHNLWRRVLSQMVAFTWITYLCVWAFGCTRMLVIEMHCKLRNVLAYGTFIYVAVTANQPTHKVIYIIYTRVVECAIGFLYLFVTKRSEMEAEQQMH